MVVVVGRCQESETLRGNRDATDQRNPSGSPPPPPPSPCHCQAALLGAALSDADLVSGTCRRSLIKLLPHALLFTRTRPPSLSVRHSRCLLFRTPALRFARLRLLVSVCWFPVSLPLPGSLTGLEPGGRRRGIDLYVLPVSGGDLIRHITCFR